MGVNSVPSWANSTVAWGFANTDADNYRSFVRTTVHGPSRALSGFAFPSVDGKAYQSMGRRSVPILWHVTVVAKDEDYVTALEASIVAAADEGSHEMVVEGVTRPTVALVGGPRRTGNREWRDASGGCIVEFDLEFEDLAG